MNNFIRFFILSLPVLLCWNANSQGFGNFLSRLNYLPESVRQAKVDSFRISNKQYPLIESDTIAYFICYTDYKQLAVAGDATSWRPDLPLIRIPGTNFWYAKGIYPKDARIEYKFVADGQKWLLDSLNPHIGVGGFGMKSELIMPGYKMPSEIIGNNEIPRGTLKDTSFYSKQMSETRKYILYFPAGYEDSKKDYPVVIFNDGEDYITYAHIHEILDYMAFDQLPLIGVFVVPVQRDAEYSGKRQKAYTNFIVKELMPYLDITYRIKAGPENHTIAGISNGGNISLWISVNHSEVFGKVIAQSSNVQNSILKIFSTKPKIPLKIYLNIGKYDIPALIPMNEKLSYILDHKGYSFSNHTYPEGHNWGFWSAHTKEAIYYLFR